MSTEVEPSVKSGMYSYLVQWGFRLLSYIRILLSKVSSNFYLCFPFISLIAICEL